jgi:alpha-ketoglutarate-dependent taurine dioxygenase
LVIRPADDIDLADWVSAHREQVESLLLEHGGLLFRGFGVSESDVLQRVVTAASLTPLEYVERSSPRSPIAGRVYTSTEHPADQSIFLHNEQSYNAVFPLRILFACAIPALEGGATPLANVREVYTRLDPALRAPFEAQGYLYVRNFRQGMGLSWQEAFQIDSREEVEAYCARHDIEYEWRGEDHLRTHQRRRAVARHPRTGVPCWFNHATFFHPSTLDPAVEAALVAAYGDGENLPNATFYGDGTPIGRDVMEALRAAYAASTVRFDWETGDLLLLDNMMTAHGRDPFRGQRRIMTVMAEPCSWSDVA